MPDGNFMPYGNLTRAQAAKIIATAIGAKVDQLQSRLIMMQK